MADGLRTPVLFATLFLLVALGGCAETSDFRHRPGQKAGAVPTVREYARSQTDEIEAEPFAESEAEITERADLLPILRMALARNPRIRGARAAWKAAIERVPQARSLPDPGFTVMHFLESVETRVGPQENVFTLMQKVPWPGKLVLRGDVASERAKIAGLRYSATVRDVLVEVKTAWYEYVYLVRARAIVERNVSIAARLASLGSELYAEDNALLIDVLKAQSQLAQIQYDLITLAELSSAERTRLNGLMDRPPEAHLGPVPAIPFRRVVVSVAELYELAAKNREELRIAGARVEEANAREALARAEFAPDFTVGGTLIQIDRNRPPLPVMPDNGEDAYGISLGLTIPLWVNRNSAAVREARALRAQALEEKIEVWNATFTAVKDASFRLANAERLVLLYRDSLVPQVEKVMTAAEETARENRRRLGDYLETQTVWLNFTLAHERALADYNQATARLERLTGANVTPVAGDSK